MLHVVLAGVYLFFTSVTLLVQLGTSNLTFLGAGVLMLTGAWAGASSTLRTKESLYAAAAGRRLQLLRQRLGSHGDGAARAAGGQEPAGQ